MRRWRQRPGLSADIIAELKAGKRPSGMAEDEAVVYDFVTELTTTQKVSDETYARAKKVFNDQQIVDLTAVAGNYVMVAMLLAMAEETVPPGKEPPFKAGRSSGRAIVVCEGEAQAIHANACAKPHGLLRELSAGANARNPLLAMAAKLASPRDVSRRRRKPPDAGAIACPIRPRWVKPNPAAYFNP